MFRITLKNGKTFNCKVNQTIYEAAREHGIILEHSCLTARCRSCLLQIESGATIDKLDDIVLSVDEKNNNWALSCNSIPTADLVLDIEDLSDIQIFEKQIVPAKIHSISALNDSVLEVNLRLPPQSRFAYNSGQYVNIIKDDIKRSYSIANSFKENSLLTFFIRKYENGQMSDYWFEKAKIDDLLRLEGPLGSFFFRRSEQENIIFLATGTGVAPIKAILEDIVKSAKQVTSKKYWLFLGARHESDMFWNPNVLSSLVDLKYIPVVSKPSKEWTGEEGYVQDIVLKHGIQLKNSQVYACGSNKMIESAKKLFFEKGLNKSHFYSDSFVQSNQTA